MRGRSLLFASFLCLAPFPAHAGDSMYVRAADTDLKSSPGAGGPTVSKLEIGTKLEVLEKRGPWAKVKVTVKKEEKTGFVFVPKLSKDKPDKERLGGGSVASASEGDTAQALRGLSPTAEKFAGRTQISAQDIASVKAMEDRKIAKDELNAFLKDGKLGEFAE